MSLFGWCTTNQHEDCRDNYIDWNKKEVFCSCSCHDRKEKKDDNDS